MGGLCLEACALFFGRMVVGAPSPVRWENGGWSPESCSLEGLGVVALCPVRWKGGGWSPVSSSLGGWWLKP